MRQKTILQPDAGKVSSGMSNGMAVMQVASALCASYIGGSVNFAAVSQSLGLTPGPLLAATMAADNIAMAAYLTLIMVIPAKNVVERKHAAAQQIISPQQALSLSSELVTRENDTPSSATAVLEGEAGQVQCTLAYGWLTWLVC